MKTGTRQNLPTFPSSVSDQDKNGSADCPQKKEKWSNFMLEKLGWRLLLEPECNVLCRGKVQTPLFTCKVTIEMSKSRTIRYGTSWFSESTIPKVADDQQWWLPCRRLWRERVRGGGSGGPAASPRAGCAAPPGRAAGYRSPHRAHAPSPVPVPGYNSSDHLG